MPFTCKLCNAVFKNRRDMKKHEDKKIPCDYRCRTCLLKCQTYNRYYVHMKKHAEEGGSKDADDVPDVPPTPDIDFDNFDVRTLRKEYDVQEIVEVCEEPEIVTHSASETKTAYSTTYSTKTLKIQHRTETVRTSVRPKTAFAKDQFSKALPELRSITNERERTRFLNKHFYETEHAHDMHDE